MFFVINSFTYFYNNYMTKTERDFNECNELKDLFVSEKL